MAEKVWQVEKVKYCEHVGQEVEIESQVIYPADILPEQPPRVVAHRCSHSLECNLVEKPSCNLCGTNPDLNLV
ncbi:MAG TPA: hypothetical protein PKL78_04500 [Anaerolineales bacterium]|nr:hypothetical protein [Anaerolineales bacterium]HNN12792.1 hypothetical protein [Anaerolineales bacterium]